MIETLCQQVLGDFPVRKTPAQKAAFRRWLTGELEELGYAVSTEEGGRLVKRQMDGTVYRFQRKPGCKIRQIGLIAGL